MTVGEEIKDDELLRTTLNGFLEKWALFVKGLVARVLVLIHMRYERYSIYYYNNECSIYREHKVTIHERMRPLNNQQLFIIIIYL
jgi:hypothetical protein